MENTSSDGQDLRSKKGLKRSINHSIPLGQDPAFDAAVVITIMRESRNNWTSQRSLRILSEAIERVKGTIWFDVLFGERDKWAAQFLSECEKAYSAKKETTKSDVRRM